MYWLFLLFSLYTEDRVERAGSNQRCWRCLTGLDDMKAESLICCLMWLFWFQIQMSSTHSRIGFAVLILLVMTVHPFNIFCEENGGFAYTLYCSYILVVCFYHTSQAIPCQHYLVSLGKNRTLEKKQLHLSCLHPVDFWMHYTGIIYYLIYPIILRISESHMWM